MGTTSPKRLHWIRQSYVPEVITWSAAGGASSDRRERLVAALADQPRTVAQLARQFGLSQPSMLEHVRRAVQDGLVVEVQVPDEERRFPSERYYGPAVPVIRGPDRELLASACRAVADDIAKSVASNLGDMHATFAMTALAGEGWSFDEIWPYMSDTINRLVEERLASIMRPTDLTARGLAWVEEAAGCDVAPVPDGLGEDVA